MKRTMLVYCLAVIAAVLALPSGTRALAQNRADSRAGIAPQANPTLSPDTSQSDSGSPPSSAPAAGLQSAAGSDSNPTGQPEVVIPPQYRPSSIASPNVVATTPVYFTPQDENTSTTVLFLYNTTSSAANVALQSFYTNGALTISTTIAVPANGLVRICADTVSTVSASWADYVLVNFTTFSAYARMDVPAGVKVDGYVAWDTTGTYDPLTSMQTLPLRFSTDPAAVFLPSVAR